MSLQQTQACYITVLSNQGALGVIKAGQSEQQETYTHTGLLCCLGVAEAPVHTVLLRVYLLVVQSYLLPLVDFTLHMSYCLSCIKPGKIV